MRLTARWVQHASPNVEADSEYRKILALCIVFTCVMIITVCARIASRFIGGNRSVQTMFRNIHTEGWVILISAVFSIIYSVLAINQTRWGLGLPLALRPKQDLLTYSKLNFAGRPFYQLGILGYKVAVALGYLRILRGVNGVFYHRLCIVITIVICVLFHIASTLVLIFQCIPVKKSWDPTHSGHCLPSVPVFYAVGAPTIAFDAIIFTFALELFRVLNPPRMQRIYLTAVFLFGITTTVFSALRLAQIHTILKSGNSTWLIAWGAMELNVGITVSCFPYVARPLKMSLQRVAGKTNSRKVFSDFSGANNIGSNGSKSRNTTNDSQEEIFDPSASTMGPEGIILKTTSFDVSTSSIKEGQMPSAIDQRFLSDRI